jgi:hypothetical protein
MLLLMVASDNASSGKGTSAIRMRAGRIDFDHGNRHFEAHVSCDMQGTNRELSILWTYGSVTGEANPIRPERARSAAGNMRRLISVDSAFVAAGGGG